jgi:hypothetical protein
MAILADARCARLAAVDADGSVWLASDGGAIAARVLASVPLVDLHRALAEDLPVLIAAEPPVIIGVVLGRAVDRPDLRLENGRAVLDAARELVLRCGAGAIRIQADGTVRIDGTNVRSHARRLQRITGAQVRIN